MEKLGVDVYITGSYKWLCAPFGTAIAFISKDLYDIIDPVFVGWRTSKVIWDFNAEEITYPSSARKFEYSTSAYGVKLGMVESIRYLLELGIENIYEHNMRLDKMLRDELEEIIGVELMRINDHGPIVSFTVSARAHLYNSENDIHEFVDGLKKALR